MSIMTLHAINPLPSSAAAAAPSDSLVAQARIQLAAAHRLAVLHELEEGIDNHFTVSVPGRGGAYLILPFGLHWSEARASDLMVFDEQANVLQGEGVVELSAQCIHAPIHRITGAAVVLHTHQTWAVTLNMLKDNRLLAASQTAAFYHGLIAYDDNYAGTADTLQEGERLANLMGDKPIVFMKNHGILVTGNSVPEAYRRLYRLERVCRNQVLALSTGCEIEVMSDEVARRVQVPGACDRHTRQEREDLFFAAMMRVLDRENPGYRD